MTGGRASRPAFWLFGAIAASLFAGHWLAAPVAADGLTRGEIVVQADHVDPGAAFKVTGSDLDEDAPVEIELVSGDARALLGTATTKGDGTLDVDVVLPTSFPVGYATLQVRALGTTWTTTVLVGARAEGPGARPQVDAAWIAVALVALVGVVIVALTSLRASRVGRRRGVVG